MHRRTVLKFAAGMAGAVTVGASVNPTTATAGGGLVDLDGWPPEARFDAIATGRSGTWAIGLQDLHETPEDWRRRAILRRLHRHTWVPVALPDSFAASGKAIAPDATGVWIAGTRNDVTLPVSDGSAVVGHLGNDGTWRTVNTDNLPRYAQYGSLLVTGGRMELTGYRPVEGGPGFLPYCVTRPLADPTARWSEVPISWTDGSWDETVIMKIGSGTTDWATAGTRLLRRTRSGWTPVDSPPGAEAMTHQHCAVAGRSLYLSAINISHTDWTAQLYRRVGSSWTTVKLPDDLTAFQLAATKDGCWAVGALLDSRGSVNAAMVVQVSRSEIARRIRGPEGMIDLGCLAGHDLLLSGIKPDPSFPDHGWVGHPWLVRT